MSSSEYRLILVFDPGANAGVALFVDGHLVDYQTADGDRFESLNNVAVNMVSPYQSIDTNRRLSIIEDGFFGKFLKGSGTLYMRRGLCQAVSENNGVYFHEFVQPATWQNRLFGPHRGKNTKDLSREFVKNTYKKDLRSADVCDSICIGHWFLNKDIK
jgi:hypothetical protein